jgi:hypothetical protein
MADCRLRCDESGARSVVGPALKRRTRVANDQRYYLSRYEIMTFRRSSASMLSPKRGMARRCLRHMSLDVLSTLNLGLPNQTAAPRFLVSFRAW